ncbi:hypothetical protein BDF19DRAFT_454004 [Syncephalis fuscata]|nr:hypothetical protein BDF19DRAFT_454004 [Syncephalis fuscata]
MPNPLRDPVHRTAILSGTLGFATAGAAVGGIWSMARGRSAVPYTLGMAANCGLIGFTFLATRRFILEERLDRQRSLGQKDPQLTDSDMIVSSTVAGGATGSIWSGVFYGSHRVIAGFLVLGVLTGGMQMCITAANSMRQQIILNKLNPDQAQELPLTRFKESIVRQLGELGQLASDNLAWIPIHKLTTKEHRELLQKKLDGVNAELEEVDETILNMKTQIQ